VPRLESAGRVILRRGRDARARAGHLWIYAGEIERREGETQPGAVVDVLDARGRFLGRGYHNPASAIAVRVMTRRRDETVDAALLRRRIAAAVAWRRRFLAAGETCRLVFSEGDWLPGLTVDRYGPCLVIQIGTLGMDRMRSEIVAALADALHPRGIYEKSDMPARAHEGLEPATGVLQGEVPDDLVVTVEGLRFAVALKDGQKTGLFLDHRASRTALGTWPHGRRVLDVFCHTGAFSLHALARGATEAVGIEIDALAVEAARRNAALNDLAARCRFVQGNAFDLMREMERSGERFDLVVLDPPAFTKSSRATESARRGYKEINLRALRLTAAGGLLLTASCSYHIGPEEFLAIVRDAAADVGRPVSLLSLTGQSADHPVNLQVPETRYLKCALLAVRD
jgi:23S rRNA (cytosine1962-C5)-methyltransferase